MTQILALITILLNLVATVIYVKQIIKNKSTPNPSSWAIWLIVNLVNLITYFIIVEKSIWIAFASITSTIVVLFIFLLSLIKGKFTKLNPVDVISLVIAIGIGIVWKVSGNAIVSNIALQIIFIISFIPTIRGLLKKTAKEKALPWFLGTLAYILQIIIVLFNSISVWALVFPLIQIIGQGTIALISYRKSSSNIVH